MAIKDNCLAPFLDQQRCLVVDGGLATELERHGYELRDELWSARLLRDAPHVIVQVHGDYLVAGADCVTTASYQATIPGFMRLGLSSAEAEALIQRSVELAVSARDAFWADERNRIGRIKPLVAASIGPYGAYLANGAEYTGDYDLDEDGLVDFHRVRWRILAESDADLLACETIPSLVEARALARLVAETPQRTVWVSFSCRNGYQISDGTLLAACAALLDGVPNVIAIGVNCTAPRFISALVGEIRRMSAKPIVVYPNSGEMWDNAMRCWVTVTDSAEAPSIFAAQAHSWHTEGAQLIGGCCRTTPEHVQRMRTRLSLEKETVT